jgi:hypothetical protein
MRWSLFSSLLKHVGSKHSMSDASCCCSSSHSPIAEMADAICREGTRTTGSRDARYSVDSVLCKNPVDVILVELRMPGVSGDRDS